MKYPTPSELAKRPTQTAPIFRLPDEIKRNIFALVSAQDKRGKDWVSRGEERYQEKERNMVRRAFHEKGFFFIVAGVLELS